MNYLELVPIPKRNTINSGLSPARVTTLKTIFGPFPALGTECGECHNPKVKALLQTRDVGPFRVTGIRPALDDLEHIFAAVKASHPDLYALLGTAGMMCYRCVRGSNAPSNHASGTAIDLKIHGALTPFNSPTVPRGLLALYPHFHDRGWYWAAGYNGRTDPMHFEVSDERLRQWKVDRVI